jgi:Smg protein
MKETLIDILIYLFENYIEEDISLGTDGDRLKLELDDAGFEPSQVNKAFDWLQGLSENDPSGSPLRVEGDKTFRIYTEVEQRKIDLECRGFLYFLEQTGLLNSRSREMIIERIFALDTEEIELDQLKWIILLVLLNQPEQEQAFILVEDLVMDGLSGNLH